MKGLAELECPNFFVFVTSGVFVFVVIMSSSFQLALTSLDCSLAFLNEEHGLELTKFLLNCHVCYHSEIFLREARSSYLFQPKHARGLWPKSTKLNTWCWPLVSFIAGAVTSVSFWCHRRGQRTRCYPRVTMTTQKKGLITGDLWLSIAGVSIIHQTFSHWSNARQKIVLTCRSYHMNFKIVILEVVPMLWSHVLRNTSC